MKSEQNSFSEQPDISVTPSQVIEFMYCPRFIYFMECLKIPQYEGNRIKVQLGRQTHSDKQRVNRDYLRKKIGCIDKAIDLYLNSPKRQIRGILDEALWLNDGTMAPLEYKFAEYKERLFSTYQTQLTLQAMLIQDNFNMPVHRGYIVFVRSHNYLHTTNISEDDMKRAQTVITSILEIIQTGLYPSGTRSRERCYDCCYKNICV